MSFSPTQLSCIISLVVSKYSKQTKQNKLGPEKANQRCLNRLGIVVHICNPSTGKVQDAGEVDI